MLRVRLMLPTVPWKRVRYFCHEEGRIAKDLQKSLLALPRSEGGRVPGRKGLRECGGEHAIAQIRIEQCPLLRIVDMIGDRE